MKNLLRQLCLLFCLSLPVQGMAGERELPADIVTGVLPLATLGYSWIVKDDAEGTKQLLRSTGVSLVFINSLRLAFNDTEYGERPNGSPYGFPSGHIAFLAPSAAYLQDRYGWKYGLPAWAATVYVAHNRVDTDHHKWRDVIASGVLAWGISKLFVTPENATNIAPVVGPDWLGMRIQRSF